MLIGFYICPSEITIPKDIDNYFIGSTKKIIRQNPYYNIALFGYGKKFNYNIKDGIYSLSEGGVTKRNILININQKSVEVKSDWLGSFPCFYSLEKCIVASHWGMIERFSDTTDPIGTYILKRYSYIPHGRTVLTGISRLLAMQQLKFLNGVLSLKDIKSKNKIIKKTEKDVEQATKKEIKNIYEFRKKFIVPLSGGFDSRYLACSLKNMNITNVSTSTYTLAENGPCFECVTSQAVAKKLGFNWNMENIKGYRKLETLILNWTGGFTHINGDYYEKFADQISKKIHLKNRNQYVVLSGIVGDACSGGIMIPKKYKHNIVRKIMYSHNTKVYKWMLTTKEKLLAKCAETELENYFRGKISEPQDYLIELIRGKVALLSFLCYSFERRGYPTLSPFITKSVVLSMLGLSSLKRNKRQWQKDFFKNLNIDNNNLPQNFLKVNALAINEGSKKQFCDFSSIGLNFYKVILLKIIFSKMIRRIERYLFLNKFCDVILRRIGYIRSDTLISILRVTKF